MTKIRQLLLITSVLLGAFGAGVANAQNATEVQQVSSASVPVVATSRSPATADAPTQLGSTSESNSAPSQLSDAGELPAPAEQVSRDGRDARPPEPLSRVDEGRTSAVETVAGQDRCDSSNPDRSRRNCANIIENRASQYSRSEAPRLSPEQTLMVNQQARQAATSFDAAARRLARNGESESLESLGVAALVLQSSTGAPEKGEEKPDDLAADEATAAAINAIVNGSSGPPPQ